MQENISQIERQKRFVIRFLYWGIMIGTLLFLGKYLIPVPVSYTHLNPDIRNYCYLSMLFLKTYDDLSE